MIPELGHLALILALCLALVQSSLPLVGAWRGDRQWMSLARPAAWGQFAFLAFAFGCLTWAFLRDDFSVAYVAGNSNSALPWYYKFSAVWGRPRRFAAALGADPRWLDLRRVDLLPATAGGHAGPRAGGDGHDQHRLPAVPDHHLQPVQPPAAADPDGRQRPQPAAAGRRPDRPPADALHGLRRILGGLRLRHRRTARRPPGRRLGALVAALDPGSLGLPRYRHRARLLVGLLRAGLGGAGGSGIRWKTPPSCPGWSALH
ncbi:cytochrome c-type biogenesis protein CcmF [Pseudomonas aeruginosa]|nr:cytochrome c-type biogenesis protein CcmF [Pseudomonas aeruginosa]